MEAAVIFVSENMEAALLKAVKRDMSEVNRNIKNLKRGRDVSVEGNPDSKKTLMESYKQKKADLLAERKFLKEEMC